jgi:hypothetical protein
MSEIFEWTQQTLRKCSLEFLAIRLRVTDYAKSARLLPDHISDYSCELEPSIAAVSRLER